MAAIRRLQHPPIAEAVVNFQVQLRTALTKDSLSRIPAAFKSKFPVAAELRRNEFKVHISATDGTAEANKSDKLHGFRFENSDGSVVTVFDQGQFVFSHVNHYESWETLIADAREAWDAFKAIAVPVEITRVGLRYINKCRLQLPAESGELLTASPVLPTELELDISGFFSQMTVQLPIDAAANITQLLQHEAEASYATIDVDVFRPGLAIDPNSAEPWDRLVSFREWKNRIFFSLVTEKLLEQYS